MNPAVFHRRACAAVNERVMAVKPEQWSLPTPCADWDVRSLVAHMLSENLWIPPLLENQTIEQVGEKLEGDLLGDDPKGAWSQSVKKATSAIEMSQLDQIVHLSYADKPAREYITEVAADLLVHAWDLARAIGAHEQLELDLVRLAWNVIEPVSDMGREAGAYGRAVSPPAGADPQTQLLALTGRAV